MNRIKEVLEDKNIKTLWLVKKRRNINNMIAVDRHDRAQPRLDIVMHSTEILDKASKDLIISNK